jgi:hypothetical protein
MAMGRGWFIFAVFFLPVISFFIYAIGDQWKIPILRSVGIYGVLIFGGAWLVLTVFGRSKGEEKFEVSETIVGEFEVDGDLIITDHPSFKIRHDYQKFPSGLVSLKLKIRTYEDKQVEIESFLIHQKRSPAGSSTKKSMGDLVVDSGYVFIASEKILESVQAALPVEKSKEVFESSTRAILLSAKDGRPWGAVILPPWGDGAYPVTELHDDVGPWGIECCLMPEED